MVDKNSQNGIIKITIETDTYILEFEPKGKEWEEEPDKEYLSLDLINQIIETPSEHQVSKTFIAGEYIYIDIKGTLSRTSCKYISKE